MKINLWIENLANLLEQQRSTLQQFHVERINLSGLLTRRRYRSSRAHVACATTRVCESCGKTRRCRRKRGRHECSPSDTRGGDRRGSWSMDPEERANVNVSPDVPSPIFFYPSHEHRSHAEAVTYVRMPVARSALLERPCQTVNSSAKGFYQACVVPFSFLIITSRGISRSTLIPRRWSSRWIESIINTEDRSIDAFISQS